MRIWSINSKESLESLLFMVSFKKTSSIIKDTDIDVMRQSACLVINPITVKESTVVQW